MTARLDLEEHSYYGYKIAWWDEPNDIVGDLTVGEKLPVSEGDEAEEHNYITDKLAERCPPDHVGDGTFYWESKSSATKALRAARALQKQWKNRDRPWPEWAIKASSEGWKPPKGWRL